MEVVILQTPYAENWKGLNIHAAFSIDTIFQAKFSRWVKILFYKRKAAIICCSNDEIGKMTIFPLSNEILDLHKGHEQMANH